jgi:hypothetical protein
MIDLIIVWDILVSLIITKGIVNGVKLNTTWTTHLWDILS